MGKLPAPALPSFHLAESVCLAIPPAHLPALPVFLPYSRDTWLPRPPAHPPYLPPIEHLVQQREHLHCFRFGVKCIVEPRPPYSGQGLTLGLLLQSMLDSCRGCGRLNVGSPLLECQDVLRKILCFNLRTVAATVGGRTDESARREGGQSPTMGCFIKVWGGSHNQINAVNTIHPSAVHTPEPSSYRFLQRL